MSSFGFLSFPALSFILSGTLVVTIAPAGIIHVQAAALMMVAATISGYAGAD